MTDTYQCDQVAQVAELAVKAGEMQEVPADPWLGKTSLEEEMANSPSDSCLWEPTDRGPWGEVAAPVATRNIKDQKRIKKKSVVQPTP